MQTAGKQKKKRDNSSRMRSGAAALCAALLLLLSGCGAASDGQAAEQQAAGLRQGQPGHAQLAGFQHHHPAPGRHGLQRRALGRPQPEGLQQGLRLRALDVHIPLHIIKGVGRAAGIFVPVPVGFPQGFFFRLNVRLPACRLPRRLFFFHGAGPARCPAPPFTRRSSASSFRLLVRPFFCAAGRRLFRRLRPSAMRAALRPGAKY